MKQSVAGAASSAFTLCLNDNFMLKINFVVASGESNLWSTVFISVLSVLDASSRLQKASTKQWWLLLIDNRKGQMWSSALLQKLLEFILKLRLMRSL